MSRTDVHRPYWVLAKDPTVRHWFKDFHHHEAGVCDFDPAEPTRLTSKQHCYRQQWSQCPNLCGCGLCTAQWWRRYRHSQDRAAWRRIARTMLTSQADDRQDVDTWIPPDHYWG